MSENSVNENQIIKVSPGEFDGVNYIRKIETTGKKPVTEYIEGDVDGASSQKAWAAACDKRGSPHACGYYFDGRIYPAPKLSELAKRLYSTSGQKCTDIETMKSSIEAMQLTYETFCDKIRVLKNHANIKADELKCLEKKGSVGDCEDFTGLVGMMTGDGALAGNVQLFLKDSAHSVAAFKDADGKLWALDVPYGVCLPLDEYVNKVNRAQPLARYTCKETGKPDKELTIEGCHVSHFTLVDGDTVNIYYIDKNTWYDQNSLCGDHVTFDEVTQSSRNGVILSS